jgi:Tol biopolymer transport system component
MRRYRCARQPAPAERSVHRVGWWWTAAALVLGAGLGFAAFKFTRPSEAPPSFRPITYSGDAAIPAISPDGKQVAYFWRGDRKAEPGMYVQLVGGGNPLRLPIERVRGKCAWSPDSSRIAFAGQDGIFVMSALGGDRRRVATGVNARNIAWSPDGNFFVWDGNGLSAASAEGGDIRPLTKPATGEDSRAAISPDGSTLAFIRSTSTFNSAIFVLPLKRDGSRGGTEQQITSGVWDIGSLDWIDNRQIIFEGSAGSNNPSLWRIARGRGDPVHLITPSVIAGNPTVARQTGRIVYVSGQFQTKIFKVALGSKGASDPLPVVDAIGLHSDLSVSPDGAHLVFASNRTGSKEIWTADSDGGNQAQVTSFNGPAVGSPAFSPDGKRIAFDGYASGSSDIYLVPADGGKPQRLTTDPGNEVRPSWSHDGQWVYYAWTPIGKDRAIWKIRPAGGDPVRVASRIGNAFETPDGKWLYVSDPPKLWRMRPDGSEETLVNDRLRGTNFWTLGGRSAYFLGPTGSDVFRAPFEGGTTELAYRLPYYAGSGKAFAVPNDESQLFFGGVTGNSNTLMLMEGSR